jgi:hypothetical protein
MKSGLESLSGHVGNCIPGFTRRVAKALAMVLVSFPWCGRRAVGMCSEVVLWDVRSLQTTLKCRHTNKLNIFEKIFNCSNDLCR